MIAELEWKNTCFRLQNKQNDCYWPGLDKTEVYAKSHILKYMNSYMTANQVSFDN